MPSPPDILKPDPAHFHLLPENDFTCRIAVQFIIRQRGDTRTICKRYFMPDKMNAASL
jgi:hypothetical protein